METYKRNIKAGQRLEFGVYQFLDHFIGRNRVFKIFGRRRKAFNRNLLETLKKSGEGKTIQIERRKDLSLKEFRKHYLRKGIPVIMEGAAKDWDCVKKWSLEYFKELHGTDEVVLSGNVKGKIEYEIMSLSDIIDNIQQGGDKYYRFYPLLARHPEHIKDFDYWWLKARKNKYTMFHEFRAFMGGKGTGTPLHSENRANLFIQASGEKKWVLYPPYYMPVIDPDRLRNIYRSMPSRSDKGPFDGLNPNYDPPYTGYKYIDHYETILKPGDVLWVPAFYWHAVLNVSHSIGIGYRWFNPFESFRQVPLYMFLDFFATKPSFWKSIKLSKEDINLILVAESGKLAQYREELKARELARKAVSNG